MCIRDRPSCQRLHSIERDVKDLKSHLGLLSNSPRWDFKSLTSRSIECNLWHEGRPWTLCVLNVLEFVTDVVHFFFNFHFLVLCSDAHESLFFHFHLADSTILAFRRSVDVCFLWSRVIGQLEIFFFYSHKVRRGFVQALWVLRAPGQAYLWFTETLYGDV